MIRLIAGFCLYLVFLHLGIGQSDEEHSFNVPAGKAEETLELFAQQSKQPSLFSNAVVRGFRTNAVQGKHTSATALSKMLSGTGLSVIHDTLSGALVISKNLSTSRVIELPPFVLEQPVYPPWLYASVPGVEVVSRCSEEITANLVDRQHRLKQLLSLILPPRFQVQHDVPLVFVLNNPQTQPEVSRELIEKMNSGDNSIDSDQPKDPDVRFMPNFRFWDRDSMAVYFQIDSISFDNATITLTPSYLRYLMKNRTPALPDWFIEGMLHLYQRISLPVEPIVYPLADDVFYALGSSPAKEEEVDVITVFPFIWLSKEESEKIIELARSSFETTGRAQLPDSFEFIPLGDLLLKPMPGETTSHQRNLWKHEAALFIRWCFDPNRSDLNGVKNQSKLAPRFLGPQALWNYVDRVSREPASEAIFIECFGETFAQVEHHLRGYLPTSTLNSGPHRAAGTFKIRPSRDISPPPFEIDHATFEEIARVRGRLERLEILYIKQLHPKLTETYVNQARRTLTSSYQAGDRDPRLLAELGLLECDAGNDKAALPFLRDAAVYRVVSPRVYFELARINYEQMRAEAPESTLTDTQVYDLVDILEIAFTQSPALPEIYELLIKIWLQSEAVLLNKHFELLNQVAELFPHSFRLNYGIALLYAREGKVAETQSHIQQALRWIDDPKEQAKFLQLQNAVR